MSHPDRFAMPSMPSMPSAPAMSRRGLLAGALAGAAAPVWSGFAAPALTPAAQAAELPMVTPRWSHAAWQSFGVCAMPTHDKSSYHYRSQWMANLDSMGASYIRGSYGDGFSPTYETVSLARKHGITWGMNVLPDLGMSDDRIRARIADIAARAADVCLFIEGINEPNSTRDGSRVPDDWRQRTLAKQRVIWNAVRSHSSLNGVSVLGPSLHMVKATDSDYQWFAANGLLSAMTHAGTHCYPAGWYPDRTFNDLLGPVRRYWPKPIWITETGYTNAMATSGGHKPTPEDVAAIYAPSALLEAVDRGYRTAWFEVLDDPDSGAKDQVEANLGLWALQSGSAPPWRAKPAVSALRGFLGGLKDPGSAYRPPAVALKVSSSAGDVRWTALGKRDGSVRLYLRRSNPCWDPFRRVRLQVPNASVTVSTARGSRSVSVGSKVVTLQL